MAVVSWYKECVCSMQEDRPNEETLGLHVTQSQFILCTLEYNTPSIKQNMTCCDHVIPFADAASSQQLEKTVL